LSQWSTWYHRRYKGGIARSFPPIQSPILYSLLSVKQSITSCPLAIFQASICYRPGNSQRSSWLLAQQLVCKLHCLPSHNLSLVHEWTNSCGSVIAQDCTTTLTIFPTFDESPTTTVYQSTVTDFAEVDCEGCVLTTSTQFLGVGPVSNTFSWNSCQDGWVLMAPRFVASLPLLRWRLRLRRRRFVRRVRRGIEGNISASHIG